jgi:hypothetical protein
MSLAATLPMNLSMLAGGAPGLASPWIRWLRSRRHPGSLSCIGGLCGGHTEPACFVRSSGVRCGLYRRSTIFGPTDFNPESPMSPTHFAVAEARINQRCDCPQGR